MASLTSQAVVLRTYMPYAQKVSLLVSGVGRIDAVIQPRSMAQRLGNGALLDGVLRKWGSNTTLAQVELIEVPFYWGATNLSFLHHVLELCFYFLPLDQEADDIFQLVKLLYTLPELFKEKLAQKIFLSKFFQRIGLYPYDRHTYSALFLRLILAPRGSNVDKEFYENFTDTMDKQLGRWLLGCVSSHPYGHRLKTIDFLKKLDVHE